MITLSNQFNEVINRNKCVAAFEMYQTEFDVEMSYSRITKHYQVNVYIYRKFRSQTEVYKDFKKVRDIAKRLDLQLVNEESVMKKIQDESEDFVFIWFEI